MKALHQLNERVRARVRECVERSETYMYEPEAVVETVARKEQEDSVSLPLVAALHPLLQTLVSGVADIYQQRLCVMRKILQADAQEQLSVTLEMMRSARATQRYAQACGESCLQRLRADIEEQFSQEHAQALAVLGAPHMALEARLEHSIQQASQQDIVRMCPQPTLPLPALPEPLPWRQLEARILQWREQAAKAREVMQASLRGPVDGMRLSHVLRALPSAPPTERDSDTLEDWPAVLLPHTQALAQPQESVSMVLLARLRGQHDSARRTAERVQCLVARTARAHLLRHFGALERWEAHYAQQLAAKKAQALAASALGEEALKKELEAATAQSPYAWRAVQRAVQSISDHFGTGMRAAAESTAAASRQALGAEHDLDGHARNV